jgi:cytochrome c peroxidase
MRRILLIPLAVVVVGACTDHTNYSDWEWSQLQSLSPLPAKPPPDTSNKYIDNPMVQALGQKFYFDPQFSGKAEWLDQLGHTTLTARAPLGQEMNISCNTCHDVTLGGSDHSSVPRNVSIGSGAYDVNANQVYNSAYYPLVYWNGRNDSLWSQIVSVEESDISMAGDRMKVVWRIVDAYKSDYNTAFPDWPLPSGMDSVVNEAARENPDGTCKLDSGGNCPTSHCATVMNTKGDSFCMPRFPLRGKPGYEGFESAYIPDGTQRLCEHGDTTTFTRPEPYGDAFDCMATPDQKSVNRIYVNFAKAIATYEYELVSRDSAFDKFMAGTGDLSPAAQRGAKLFVGKASCIDCHNTPLFSDGDFHNIGIPQVGAYVPTSEDCPLGGWCDCQRLDDQNPLPGALAGQPNNCLPWGARDGLRKLQSSSFRRDTFYSDDGPCQNNYALHAAEDYDLKHATECDGKVKYYALVRKNDTPADMVDGVVQGGWIGKWRTPGLRDVELTAPYMHNGMFQTLQDVIWNYNWGGIDGENYLGQKDPRLHPLQLTDDEVGDLIEFLKTLTGAPLDSSLTTAPTLPAPSAFP